MPPPTCFVCELEAQGNHVGSPHLSSPHSVLLLLVVLSVLFCFLLSFNSVYFSVTQAGDLFVFPQAFILEKRHIHQRLCTRSNPSCLWSTCLETRPFSASWLLVYGCSHQKSSFRQEVAASPRGLRLCLSLAGSSPKLRFASSGATGLSKELNDCLMWKISCPPPPPPKKKKSRVGYSDCWHPC